MGKEKFEIIVTATCERCGKKKVSTQNDLVECDVIERHGYYLVRESPLTYRGYDLFGTSDGEEKFLCPECIEEREVLLDGLVKEFNKKAKGFLEKGKEKRR